MSIFNSIISFSTIANVRNEVLAILAPKVLRVFDLELRVWMSLVSYSSSWAGLLRRIFILDRSIVMTIRVPAS